MLLMYRAQYIERGRNGNGLDNQYQRQYDGAFWRETTAEKHKEAHNARATRHRPGHEPHDTGPGTSHTRPARARATRDRPGHETHDTGPGTSHTRSARARATRYRPGHEPHDTGPGTSHMRLARARPHPHAACSTSHAGHAQRRASYVSRPLQCISILTPAGLHIAYRY